MSRLVKKELVQNVSDATGIRHEDVDLVLKTLTQHITESLCHGKEVSLREFGRFSLKACRPKVGRNPLKPEKSIAIPARYQLQFTPAAAFEQRIKDLPPPQF
jgi:integration host factor subunit beta